MTAQDTETGGRPQGPRFRLPARWRTGVFIFFMTLMMGLVLSAIMTLQADGFGEWFIVAWLERFAKTYVLVVPTVLVVSPIANRLTDAIVEAPNDTAAQSESSA